MEGSENIEKAYELIEQFEFADLSDADRAIVLSAVTEEEYKDMRRTVCALSNMMVADIEPRSHIPPVPQQSRSGRLLRMLNYEVKLYQVAASVAMLIASYVVIQSSNQHDITSEIARVDTVFVQQTDTVYATIHDTVRIVLDNPDPVQKQILKRDISENVAHSDHSIDCAKALCPSELGELTSMNPMNSISSDSSLKRFMVAL